MSPTEFFQMRLENNTNIKQTVMLCLFPKTITGIGAGVPRQDARRCWIAEADKKQPKFLLFKLVNLSFVFFGIFIDYFQVCFGISIWRIWHGYGFFYAGCT